VVFRKLLLVFKKLPITFRETADSDGLVSEDEVA